MRSVLMTPEQIHSITVTMLKAQMSRFIDFSEGKALISEALPDSAFRSELH